MYLLLHLRWNPRGKRSTEELDHMGVTQKKNGSCSAMHIQLPRCFYSRQCRCLLAS